MHNEAIERPHEEFNHDTDRIAISDAPVLGRYSPPANHMRKLDR